jgi:2-C-methyl-D-erythritol 4-phosphate cytidylyltransferase
MRATLPKQYLALNDRPVIAHALARLCAHARVHGVWVGIAADDAYWRAHAAEWACSPKLRGTYPGGATRADTVLNGLAALAGQAQDHDWVLVHDAVRPCLRGADVDRLIADVEATEDGGLLALPMADTVKRGDEQGCVVETVSRRGLWRALTPQMFRVGRLREALQQAHARGIEVTDEAMAIELAGGHPRLVPGHPDNIKITLPGDLALAELFLKQQASDP